MPEPNEGDVFYDIEGFLKLIKDLLNIFTVYTSIMEKNLNSKILQSKTLPKQQKKKFLKI